MTTVMCFGTFDLLHLGHLDYFRQAKKDGDKLVVVIARDSTKENEKKVPVFDEHERQELVQALELVDEAILGHTGNHLKIIEERKPDVLCLGYDHPISEKELAERLLKLHLYPKIVRARAYKQHNHKSTTMKEKIMQSQ
ncbi:TPA: adenylyltransferase/cytidyltransferase family protein [Candidatus Woesearchaeota archaeon]|nr:FAD synthase [archaeon]HIJ11126.1 adenylyltransferase/cytidyltransferase family protein [Candidatus Woesearchaeota archaeon]